jgi:predicted ferric reductase
MILLGFFQIFAQISLQKKGKKKVFFCGPVALADTIKHLCEKYSFGFAKENF